jgi:hypothetical protein
MLVIEIFQVLDKAIDDLGRENTVFFEDMTLLFKRFGRLPA